MKALPILFNAEMIRALIDGRKTQTRRALKQQPMPHAETPRKYASGNWLFHYDNETEHRCPYGQPSDLLWVRENFLVLPEHWEIDHEKQAIHYAADCNDPRHVEDYKKKPSIHMPKWASRLTLKITDIRVGRVQDVSKNDAIAEGVRPYGYGCDDGTAVNAYKNLWNSINNNWHENPWVWVVEFEVKHKNVNEVTA